MKRIKHLLQLLDGIWSLPLAFFAFYFVGIALGWLFGYGTGSYDAAFIQPLFLAGAVVIGATNMAVWGVWFNFRVLHKYVYGTKNKQGYFFNPSKIDYKNLRPLQKIIIALFMILFFITSILMVYLQLV